MSSTLRQRPLADAGAVHGEELDTQSADVQRVLAIRRRRAAVLEQLKRQHAARTQPLPLWLSVGLIVLLMWLADRFSDKLWGLEHVTVPVVPEA